MQYQICVLVIKMIETELKNANQHNNNEKYCNKLLAAKWHIEQLMVHF